MCLLLFSCQCDLLQLCILHVAALLSCQCFQEVCLDYDFLKVLDYQIIEFPKCISSMRCNLRCKPRAVLVKEFESILKGYGEALVVLRNNFLDC